MGTVPAPKKPDEEPSALENGVRSAIAGHPRGAVRRIVLWVIALLGIGVALSGHPDPLAAVSLIVTLAALLLLALSDQLA